MSLRYEIAIDTKDLSPDLINGLDAALFWAGYEVYLGIDRQVCFKMTDEEVTEIKTWQN